MLETFLTVVTGWEVATGSVWVETKDVAKRPTVHRTAFRHTKLSSLRCQ